MTLVQLRDGRIKEFDTKEKAEKYASVTAGVIVSKKPPVKPKRKLKQFWERKQACYNIVYDIQRHNKQERNHTEV